MLPLLAEVFREQASKAPRSPSANAPASKGSLYHFFPGGKEEMAAEILADVDAWFIRDFKPLERDEPARAIAAMWKSVDDYFRSGRRVCLIGAFALDETRDRFAKAIKKRFRPLGGASLPKR